MQESDRVAANAEFEAAVKRAGETHLTTAESIQASLDKGANSSSAILAIIAQWKKQKNTKYTQQALDAIVSHKNYKPDKNAGNVIIAAEEAGLKTFAQKLFNHASYNPTATELNKIILAAMKATSYDFAEKVAKHANFVPENDLNSAILYACRAKKYELALFFLHKFEHHRKKCNLNYYYFRNEGLALHHPITEGKVAIVKEFLAYGANPAKNYEGITTPIAHALDQDQDEIILILLNAPHYTAHIDHFRKQVVNYIKRQEKNPTALFNTILLTLLANKDETVGQTIMTDLSATDKFAEAYVKMFGTPAERNIPAGVKLLNTCDSFIAKKFQEHAREIQYSGKSAQVISQEILAEIKFQAEKPYDHQKSRADDERFAREAALPFAEASRLGHFGGGKYAEAVPYYQKAISAGNAEALLAYIDFVHDYEQDMNIVRGFVEFFSSTILPAELPHKEMLELVNAIEREHYTTQHRDKTGKELVAIKPRNDQELFAVNKCLVLRMDADEKSSRTFPTKLQVREQCEKVLKLVDDPEIKEFYGHMLLDPQYKFSSDRRKEAGRYFHDAAYAFLKQHCYLNKNIFERVLRNLSEAGKLGYGNPELICQQFPLSESEKAQIVRCYQQHEFSDKGFSFINDQEEATIALLILDALSSSDDETVKALLKKASDISPHIYQKRIAALLSTNALSERIVFLMHSGDRVARYVNYGETPPAPAYSLSSSDPQPVPYPSQPPMSMNFGFGDKK